MSVTISITKARLIHLKVKIKHLALEPKIIKHEEQKALKRARWERTKDGNNSGELFAYQASVSLITLLVHIKSRYEDYRGLMHHRKFVVRKESRAALLAYAFLRGKPFSSVERPFKPYSIIHSTLIRRAAELVIGFGSITVDPPKGLATGPESLKMYRLGQVEQQIKAWIQQPTEEQQESKS